MSETIDEESAVVEATEPSPLPSGEDEEAAVAGSAPEAEATNLGVTVDGGEAVTEVAETATEAAENESADKSPEEEVAAGETEDASATVDADGAGSEDGDDGGASGADAAPSVEDGTASSETAPADGENGPANEGEVRCSHDALFAYFIDISRFEKNTWGKRQILEWSDVPLL